MGQPPSHPERPPGSRRKPVVGSALAIVSALVVALGVALALYATLGLPSNEHSSLGPVLGWVQFGLASGVPLAAAVAILGAARLRSGEAGPQLALVALVTALVCLVGWVLLVSG